MLTKKEQKETIDVTIGRIRGAAKNLGSERILDLINKVSEDLDKERFPEAYDETYNKNIIAGVDFTESLEKFDKLIDGISLSTELNPNN